MFRIPKGLPCVLIACFATTAHAGTYTFNDEEDDYDDQYLATAIELTGAVVDESGNPLKDAEISLIAWGDSSENDDLSTSTSSSGDFSLPDLSRRNALVKIELEGYYNEIVPVELQRPLAEDSIDIGTITLVARYDGRVRLIFGGDTMIARKYLDKDQDGVEGESSDLVHLDTIASDTEALFAYVRDVLESDDHTSVNLETAVTDDLSTPHDVKKHVFHTYPESLSVFRDIGIESVSLGNNHFFDYKDTGVSNTLDTLSDHGLGYYGGGNDESEARENRYTKTINALNLAFQGFNQQKGTNYGDDPLHIVAKDDPLIKGGALYLNSSNLSEFVTEEAPMCFTVPYFHGGTEYTWHQTDSMRDRFKSAIDDGAGIVMAAHPHYAQGVATYDGGDGPRYIFGSLGNFVFDMGFFESLRTYLAVVDVDHTTRGPQVSRVRLVPVWLDGYVPRLMVGHRFDRMARQLGHLSTNEGTFGDGINGATVFADNGQIVVASDTSEYATSDMNDFRLAEISSGTTGIIDLEEFGANDFLTRLTTDRAATCEIGRDIMMLGGFEDGDVDMDAHEGDRWSRSGSHFVQNSVTRSGTSAGVILRKDYHSKRSVLWIYNKIKVTAGKKLTITGFYKGDNAGDMNVGIRFYKSSGSSLSNTTMYNDEPGTYDWKRFSIDVTVPEDAAKMKVYLRGYPPDDGQARYFFDDVAIVEWDDQTHDATDGVDFATPNDWSYVRCDPDSGSSSLGVTLRHKTYTSK